MDRQKQAMRQGQLGLRANASMPELARKQRPGHQPPPNYLSQAAIDQMEQQRAKDHRFLAALAGRHVQMQVKEGQKLRGSSQKSHSAQESQGRKTDGKYRKERKAGARLSDKPESNHYGTLGHVDLTRPPTKVARFQEDFFLDSRSLSRTKQADLSTFRAQNSSFMDAVGTLERTGKRPVEQDYNMYIAMKKQPMPQEAAADQYVLEQVLHKYLNRYQFVPKPHQENAHNMASDLSRAKHEPQLQDPMSKMSRTKLQEAAQSNLQSFSAMHSTELFRPQDTTSLDNYPLLTNAGQFDFPAHLFTSHETSAQLSQMQNAGGPIAGGPSFQAPHPLAADHLAAAYRNPLRAPAADNGAPSSTHDDAGQGPLLHSARFNDGTVTIGDAEQRPGRNESTSQEYLMYQPTEKSAARLVEEDKKNHEMLTFEGQEAGEETLRKDEGQQRVRDLENVLTFSYQSLKSDERQQLLQDENNRDGILTIARQSQDYSQLQAGRNLSGKIADERITPITKSDQIRLSDPVTKTVTQNDDRSMKTPSQYNIQQRVFGPLGVDYRPSRDGGGGRGLRQDDENSSLYRVENQQRKDQMRRTVSGENNNMNRKNLQRIKLHAARSKSSLIRGGSSRQNTSPGHDQYQLNTGKYHDQEMQVDMMSLSQRTKEELDMISSKEGQDFRMVIHSRVNQSKSQTSLLIQELLDGTSMSPEEKIAIIRQLQLDSSQIDRIMELLILKKEQYQNMEHLEELKLQNVASMSISQRVSILSKRIRHGFPSLNQIVLLVLHGQDEQTHVMKRSKSEGRSPKDAVLYFLTYSDLLRLKKAQRETQIRLDNENRVKYTSSHAAKHANTVFDRHGMPSNQRPKQKRNLLTTVNWKVKVDGYQASLLERFFASLIQRGRALRLIRHAATSLLPEQNLYPNDILPDSFTSCYYAPIGQRHFAIKERQLTGDDLRPFWGKPPQHADADHREGDLIKEIATNVDDGAKRGDGAVKREQSADGPQLQSILFEKFLVNALDLVGIKGIAKTDQIIKKVQHFWANHNEQAQGVLEELQMQKERQDGVKVAKQACSRSGLPANPTSSSSPGRVKKIDMTSPSILRISNEPSARARENAGVEYRGSEESPDYFTNTMAVLAADPNRHLSFKDSRKGTLYNTSTEIESQIPASALLPKVLPPQQLISGTSRENFRDGGPVEDGGSVAGVSAEKDAGIGRKTFRVDLRNTDLSPQMKTDSAETANCLNLNQDLLDPFAASKESLASKVEPKNKVLVPFVPQSQSHYERSNERASDSVEARKRQLNHPSHQSNESPIGSFQPQPIVTRFEATAPNSSKVKQSIATGPSYTNYHTILNAPQNLGHLPIGAHIVIKGNAKGKERNNTTSQVSKVKKNAGETQRWANQPIADKRLGGLARNSTAAQGMEWLRQEVKRSHKSLTQQFHVLDDPEDLVFVNLSQTNFQIGGIAEQMNDLMDQHSTANMRLRGYNVSNLQKSAARQSALKNQHPSQLNDYKVFASRRSTQPPPKARKGLQEPQLATTSSAYALPPTFAAKAGPSASLSQPATTLATPAPERPLFLVSTNQRATGCSLDKVDSFATHALIRARSNGNLENRKGCVAREKQQLTAGKGRGTLGHDADKRRRAKGGRDESQGGVRRQQEGRLNHDQEGQRIDDEEKRSLQEMNELDRQISTTGEVNALEQRQKDQLLMAVNVQVKMPGAQPDDLRKDAQLGQLSGVNYFAADAKKQGQYQGSSSSKMDHSQSLRMSGRNSIQNPNRVVFQGKTLPEQSTSNRQNEYADSSRERGGSALDILSSTHRDQRNAKGANTGATREQEMASRQATLQRNQCQQSSIGNQLQQQQQVLLVKQYEMNGIERGMVPMDSEATAPKPMARTDGFHQMNMQQLGDRMSVPGQSGEPSRGASSAAGKRAKADERSHEIGNSQQNNQIARRGSGLVKGLALVGSKSSKLIHHLQLKQDLSKHSEYNLLAGAYGQRNGPRQYHEENAQLFNKIQTALPHNDSRHKLHSDSVTVLGTRQVSLHTSNHDEHLQNMENATASEYALILLNRSESKARNLAVVPHDPEAGQNYKFLQEISIDNQNDRRGSAAGATASPQVTQGTLRAPQSGKALDSLAAESPIGQRQELRNSDSSMTHLQQQAIGTVDRSAELLGDELVQQLDQKQGRSGARNNSRDQGKVEMQRIVTKIGNGRVIKQKKDNPSQSNSTLMYESRRTQGLLGSNTLNKTGSELRKLTAQVSSDEQHREAIESRKGLVSTNVKQMSPFDDGGHGEVSLDKSLYSPERAARQGAILSANSRNPNQPGSNLLVTPSKRDATGALVGDDEVSHSFKNERIRNEVRVTTSGARRRHEDNQMFTSDTQTAQFLEGPDVVRQASDMKSSPSKTENLIVLEDVKRQHSKGIEKQAKKSVYSSRKDTNYNSRVQSQEGNRFSSNIQKVRQINQDLMGNEPYISMGESAANQNHVADIQTVEQSEPQALSRSRQSEDVLELITKSILEQDPNDANAGQKKPEEPTDAGKIEPAAQQVEPTEIEEKGKGQNRPEGSRFQSVAVSTSKTKTPVNQQGDPNMTVSISQEMESLARNYSLVIVAKSPLPRPVKSKPAINYSPVQKRNTTLSKNVGTSFKQLDLAGEDHDKPSAMQLTNQDEVLSQDIKKQSSGELVLEDHVAHQSKTRVIKSQIGQVQQAMKKREEAGAENENQSIPLVFIKSPQKKLEETMIASGNDAESHEKQPAGDQDVGDASLNQRQDPGSLTLTQRVAGNSMLQQSIDNEQIGDVKVDQAPYLRMDFHGVAALRGAEDPHLKIKGQEIVLEYQQNLDPGHQETQDSAPTPDSSEPAAALYKQSYREELALIRTFNQKHQQSQQLKPYQEQMLNRNMSMLTRKRQLASRKKGAPSANARKTEERQPPRTALASGTRQQLLRVASAGLERDARGAAKQGNDELLLGDPRTSREDDKNATVRSQINGAISSKNRAALEAKKVHNSGVISTTHSNDIVLNFNQNFMLPITITEKRSEERTSEHEGTFENKKQSTSSQALPRYMKQSQFFDNKRFSNQIKHKKADALMRPESSIDELASYKRQLRDCAQSKKEKVQAWSKFPMAVLDHGLDNAFGQNAMSTQQMKVKSKSAAKHANQIQRQKTTNAGKKLQMSQSTFGNWKYSEGQRDKSNDSHESGARLKTAPGLTQSYASNVLKASQASNQNYGSTKQIKKNIDPTIASQFYVSTGFHDTSKSDKKFVLTSNKIRPLERITKTSHQQNRYGMNKKKAAGVGTVLQTEGYGSNELQNERAALNFNASDRFMTGNLQTASLMPSTIHPATFSSQVYASTLEPARQLQPTMANHTDDTETFYRRADQRRQREEQQRPYDNIYQTTTYRSGNQGNSQDLKVVGTSASLATISDHGLTKVNKFRTNSVGENVRLPAVQTTASKHQFSQAGTFRDIYSSGVKTQSNILSNKASH